MELSDCHGYEVTDADLAFLGLTKEDVARALSRIRPLGTDEAAFNYFVESLTLALEAAGLADCDVRLQGSSAHFFSGSHKPTVWQYAEIFELFRSLRGRLPKAFEMRKINETIDRLWPRQEAKPRVRMFDLVYRLGIDAQPSDIDVQLSSAMLYERARSLILGHGLVAEKLHVESLQYGFVRKDIIREVAPVLDFWADEQSAILGRRVSVAVFNAEGPPDSGNPLLSSHFQDRDWVLKMEVATSDV
ncbi:hypothetical protein [Cellulomonas flavigena]|uniref:hypothetical protein n=1 Tax=Cellulomonas flavigena TaxID=1711 RepID=UPI0011D286A5|nr:hypothetical protein [Cellulomonas flavigena]